MQTSCSIMQTSCSIGQCQWGQNAQLGMTMLVIYVWSNLTHPTCYVYCSTCKDQNTSFVVACLADLQKNVMAEYSFTKHVMLADVGNQLRAGYTLGFWADEVLNLPGVQETVWFSFSEGRGKGICDSEGGRIDFCLRMAAKMGGWWLVVGARCCAGGCR